MSLTYFRTEDAIVTISDEAYRRYDDEGLRRAANDNALLAQTARTHELIAATACGGIVVAVVLFAVHVLGG